MKNIALAMIIGSLVATPVLADTELETDAVYKIRKSGDSGIQASPKSMGKAELMDTEHETDTVYGIRKSGTVKVVFRDVARAAGVDDKFSTMGASWGDYDQDGDLDLFVANRFPIEPDTRTPDSLFRNNGDGTFTNVANMHGLDDDNRKTFMGTWFDYDNNGTLDLDLAVDFVADILLSNDGKGGFTDVSASAGISGPAHAMGLGVGDLNNDGCHDLISTNNTRRKDAEHGPSTLYVNNCNGTFSNMTSSWGITGRDTVDWGVNFIDWDNDGDEDVSIVSGGMLKGGEKETNILYQNTGGKLVDVTSRVGALVDGAAFGSAWADYDNDGDLDWFIANSKKPSVLLENNSDGINFLKIRLLGDNDNRFAVGARVVLRSNGQTQIRTIQAGKGFASSEELETHFGLGSAESVDSLQVHWPDGKTTRLDNLNIKANQTIKIQKS